MILNDEQLKARARELALTHELYVNNQFITHNWLAFRADMASLHDFADKLQNSQPACKQPAEDWLLDHINFLETQAQIVIRELPRTTLKILPRLQSTGIPRIYTLCNDYLEHVDGRYDVHSFENYLIAYQEVSVLKDAECWSLPSAVRVMLIRRLAAEMRNVRHRHDVCKQITHLLEQIEISEFSDEKIRSLLESVTRKKPLGPVEIVHFVQHLSEWEPNIRMVHDWLAAHIENSESSLEQMVSFEHQLQAEVQVVCGNLVRSLHLLERQPWRLSFTKISHIEQIFKSDSKSEYEHLDVASRDYLREQAARIARQLNTPETLVAQTAVQMAGFKQSNKEKVGLPPREANLTFYLLDPDGIKTLRRELCQIVRPRILPYLGVLRHPLITYLSGSIFIFIGLLLIVGTWTLYGIDTGLLSWLIVFSALLLPLSEWAITIMHDLICHSVPPLKLLRYDFSKKLPEDAQTMVVMPIIWSSIDEVDMVIDRIHCHYLANRQQNIYFGILADFADAAVETLPDDQKIIAHAISRIDSLGKKHGLEKFFLLHRSRRYNSIDKVYMGWERKRGKLVEFIELLSGNAQTSYTTVHGQTDLLKNIRYVFTTDYDTLLPIGVVSRLVGTIHFPYNRPRLNETETRVTEGFGVLQPRVGVTFESAQKSHFAALWAGEPGIDPYAFAVSNAYQDLFGHAIFVGKGIFDVETFRKVIVNRIPENHVLSHDLLEGGFLRTGLTSDIEVVESHPSTFYAYEQRAHRWIRGDWQLLKWIGTKCKDRFDENQRIDLCGLTRWQMIDNLRRSLLAPWLLMVGILGLNILPGRSWGWETILVLTIYFPFLRAAGFAIVNRRLSSSLKVCFLQSTVKMITLPFSAILSVDAIIRTIYRLYVSHRLLLEWMTSAETDRHPVKGRVFMYEPAGYMVIFLFAVLSWMFSDWAGDGMLSMAFLILWLSARPVIQLVNKPKSEISRTWVKDARSELKDLAAKIWSFYDRYVTKDESWLPPDNVQYDPKELIAHRTSPTNIGLYLASVMMARDLGFLDTPEMINRIKATLKTIAAMEKWNGHLLNWYDTTTAEPLLPKYVSTVDSGNFVAYLMVVRQGLLEWQQTESKFQMEMEQLITEIDQYIENTNFKPLYNSDERLFSLGYHVDTLQKDTTLYDLLASESRQASFVAIALGQIPVSHWFSLGRTMTLSGKNKTLLSWSGTMFEYMMPSLIMPTYRNTIWDSTYRGVIHRQTEYADKNHVPMGISESGYYGFDYQFNYQYRAFGVPGLGLDHGLEQNLVIAPYAAILALPFSGEAGLTELRKLNDYQAKGEFGYYEAVDFTTSRLPRGQRFQVVQSYMAHHQGMSMIALVNLLLNDRMIKRFSHDLRVRTADLLLQERIPKKAALISVPIVHQANLSALDKRPNQAERQFVNPTVVPEVNVLSNRQITSVNTNTGTGMLSWKGIHITRWREDPVVDVSGAVLYLHDVSNEVTWSITPFPCENVQDAKAVFHFDKTIYEGSCQDISAKLEIAVSSNVDAEVRCLQLVNNSKTERLLEVTTFMDLALASPSADSAHPAFSKLFIETSHDAGTESLLAKKRSREDEEKEIWAVHTMFVNNGNTLDYEFETDRSKFIGRGHSLAAPLSMKSRLTGSVGAVVDPAFIMRRRISLAPGKSVHVYMVTGAADSRECAVQIVQQLREPKQIANTFHIAWIRSQIDLRHLHLTPKQAAAAQQLAGRLLFTTPLSKVRQDAIIRNTLGQSSLWPLGISGDLPIVMVTVNSLSDLPFVILLARQHQYLILLGLEVDLIVLDETIGGYQDQLMNQLRDSLSARGLGQMKRLIGLKYSQLQKNERTLLKAVARVIIRAGGPSLNAQLRLDDGPLSMAQFPQPHRFAQNNHPQFFKVSEEVEFFNGWGGYVEDGQAYQIQVQDGTYLPRPWSNILANPKFGCLLTDLGTGYSWWRNSRECKLTPWTNDPVLDPSGECIYLHDLDTKQVWSAMPKPAGEAFRYKVTHGKGFSRFEQLNGEIAHKLEVIVPLNDSLKMVKLTLKNTTDLLKRISATYYAEWVLGVTRNLQSSFIVTEWDDDLKALIARNVYQETFRNALSFLHVSLPDTKRQETEPPISWTSDRAEFIGHGGSLKQPTALLKEKLSKRTGVFYNTCGALQATVQLPANSEMSLYFLFGCASSKEEVHSLIRQYSLPSAYEDTFASVSKYWQNMVGQVQIKTPDRAMDIMMNGWLLYQTLACRLWARTAFYQAGGAFGFRDQLQDSLAFLHTDPTITRRQIFINARHQYQEGDVQHWWHEETGKGIRTRFSDDLLWLPYTVSRYLEQTNDYEILNRTVPFLQSPILQDGELERYENTVVSGETASLLEHCLRAIRHALNFGEHGIPLMGIGDWNDGMSRVGAKGRGESVWLGWFLLDILKRYTRLTNDALPALIIEQFKKEIQKLEQHLNQNAWDGAWFRRAFTDDGTWIGSTNSQECRIDAIAQSWSVISQGTSSDRQSRAMYSFDRELVDREFNLARLLTKPFDVTKPSPGYIQGYPPGIRENGGQYTHGVIWGIVAWAMLGKSDMAFELFSMLNPITHTKTFRDVKIYQNEPYVMSADIYSAYPYQGRAGWSWYTGAAGWMYQAGLEYILGIRLHGDQLSIQPCVPAHWEGFHIYYRYGETVYSIEVHCNQGNKIPLKWVIDGSKIEHQPYLQLVDDGQNHEVDVHLGLPYTGSTVG